jgi:hypothetical protein
MNSGPPTGEQAVQVTPISMDEAAVRRHLRMGDLLPAMGRGADRIPGGQGCSTGPLREWGSRLRTQVVDKSRA